MDNIITKVNAIEEAKTLFNKAKGLFAAASLNLREWESISRQFMKSIWQSYQATNSEQKVLNQMKSIQQHIVHNW